MNRQRRYNIGDRFNYLTVINILGNGKVICLCDCGNEKEFWASNIISNTHRVTKSCGCKKHVARKKRVGEERKIFSHYRGMIDRAHRHYSSSSKCYQKISVCNYWSNSFDNFYIWALSNGYKRGLTLDRIDSTGDYTPSNCRWATTKQQSRNTIKSIMIDLNGIVRHIKDWLDEFGMQDNYHTVMGRYHRGDRGMHLFREVRKGNYSKTNFKTTKKQPKLHIGR